MYSPPRMPGIGRSDRPVFSSQSYGGTFSSQGDWSIGGANHSSVTCGRSMACTPVARLASVSMSTGVRNASASLRARITKWKHSEIVEAASTTLGESPGAPNRLASRSPCSILVGRPVDGPPRCTSMMTSGISAMTARPIISVFSAMPGPEVIVQAVLPA